MTFEMHIERLAGAERRADAAWKATEAAERELGEATDAFKAARADFDTYVKQRMEQVPPAGPGEPGL